MKEWTDKEVVAELLRENKSSIVNGKNEPTVSFESLKRIVFDPRFPDAKSGKATDLIKALQTQVNELDKNNINNK